MSCSRIDALSAGFMCSSNPITLVCCWIVSQCFMLSCNAGLMSLVVEKYDFPVTWHDGISCFRDCA